MQNNLLNVLPTKRQVYEQKYRSSRMNLLVVVIFTAINLLLLVTNSDSYFLFSAFIPYFIASIGMALCGRFPAEYYEGGIGGMAFLDNTVFAFILSIAIVLTLLYLLAWLLSNKQRVGWLIFALVFFALDTVGMLLLNGIALESIMEDYEGLDIDASAFSNVSKTMTFECTADGYVTKSVERLTYTFDGEVCSEITTLTFKNAGTLPEISTPADADSYMNMDEME